MLKAEENHSLEGGQKRAGLTQFAVKSSISISLFVILLLAGEGTAQVLNRHRSSAYQSEYKSYVVWRVVPYRGDKITVDADGQRKTLYAHCDPSTFTIWMFGGSGLWGDFNRDDETIPSFVAKFFEDSGHAVCVKNYGERGWVSTQELIQLILALKRSPRKPDLVVFYDGGADSFLPWESDEVDAHLEYPVFKRKFESWGATKGTLSYLRASNTYLALQWVSGKLHVSSDASPQPAIPPQELSEMSNRTLENYSKNVSLVEMLGKEYGFQTAFFWEPWLMAGRKPLSTAEASLRSGYLRGNPGSIQVIRSTYELFRSVNRPHFFYLADIFKDHGETLYVDDSHLKTEGNRIVAEAIFQALRQSVH